MSIALKHIKERRFIKNAEEKVNLPPEELNISDTPLSVPKQTQTLKNRPSQIDYTGTLDNETTQTSNNEITTLKSEIKAKDPKPAKSLNSQTLKFWENVFNDAPILTEKELLDLLLKYYNLEGTPSNNTKCFNQIIKDEYNGYIKQTNPYSHVWELVKRSSDL